jgi:hypothetical protein
MGNNYGITKEEFKAGTGQRQEWSGYFDLEACVSLRV